MKIRRAIYFPAEYFDRARKRGRIVGRIDRGAKRLAEKC